MRWLIVTDDYPPLDGGVATWAHAAAGALAERGDEVSVLARARAGLAGIGGPHVVGVRGPSFGRRGGLWVAMAAAPRLGRVDRILATTWPVATVLARLPSPPLDVVFHGSDLSRVVPGTRRAARMLRVVRAADRCFAVSAFLAGVLGRHGAGAAVLPSPVPLDRGAPARPPPASPARWLYVARATALKGGDRFIRLVAAAGVRGTLVGDGPELERWRRLSVELGAGVRFTGRLPRAELAAVRQAHDLALLLPRRDADADATGAEGLGLVLLEAAASGVAVVGCDTGGVPEAIGPGLCLSDPDDAARCVREIGAWWAPDRGEACRQWLAAHHGPGKLADVLRDPGRRAEIG